MLFYLRNQLQNWNYWIYYLEKTLKQQNVKKQRLNKYYRILCKVCLNLITFNYFCYLALKNVSSVPEPKNENDEDGDYQKCVRFSPDNQFIVTGGSNGSCRIFKVGNHFS